MEIRPNRHKTCRNHGVMPRSTIMFLKKIYFIAFTWFFPPFLYYFIAAFCVLRTRFYSDAFSHDYVLSFGFIFYFFSHETVILSLFAFLSQSFHLEFRGKRIGFAVYTWRPTASYWNTFSRFMSLEGKKKKWFYASRRLGTERVKK